MFQKNQAELDRIGFTNDIAEFEGIPKDLSLVERFEKYCIFHVAAYKGTHIWNTIIGLRSGAIQPPRPSSPSSSFLDESEWDGGI